MYSNIDDLGVAIFVISDPNIRSSKILDLLENRRTKHQRISPIFLKQNPINFNAKRSLILSKKHLTLSEIGCAKSHLTCYEKFLSSNKDFAIIFEDDADLIDANTDAFYETTKKFLLFTDKKSKSEPTVLLYYTESANLIIANDDFYSIVGNASTTMAYLINRLAAVELLARNANYDYVADWPKGTSIKFFLPTINLFEHGSKNGSVVSLIEPDRFSSKLNMKRKILQNLRIISFENYFSNIKYFNGLTEYMRILWIPLLQWQLFRAILRLYPNAKKLKSVEKSK